MARVYPPRKGTHKCRQCGSPEHDRRNCPVLKQRDENEKKYLKELFHVEQAPGTIVNKGYVPHVPKMEPEDAPTWDDYMVLLTERFRHLESEAKKWEEAAERWRDRWSEADDRIKELLDMEKEYKDLLRHIETARRAYAELAPGSKYKIGPGGEVDKG